MVSYGGRSRQELKPNQGGTWHTGLLLGSCSATFLLQCKPTYPGSVPHISYWSIKCPHRHAHGPSCWGKFLSWYTFFPGDTKFLSSWQLKLTLQEVIDTRKFVFIRQCGQRGKGRRLEEEDVFVQENQVSCSGSPPVSSSETLYFYLSVCLSKLSIISVCAIMG